MTFAQDWANEAVGRLFNHERKEHWRQVNSLIERNNQLRREYRNGFSYQGVNYFLDGQHPVAQRGQAQVPPPILDRELFPEMARIHTLYKQVEMDCTYILQFLTKMFYPCLNHQDVRDALPDCLVELMPTLDSYSRIQKEAWPVQDKPRDLRQYTDKVLPRIQTYCATRYIY